MSEEWGVLHCIRNETEEVRVLRLRIGDVPERAGRKEIKTALERAGRVYGEGEYLWGNYLILPHDEWLEQDHSAAEAIRYSDLLDEAKGEKRVTVRFPIGLHNALVKSARGKSFNQYCVDTMAAAIGYEQEPLAPALPRLAQMLDISEDEMAVRVQKVAEGVQPMLGSEFVQKFGRHLANIASMPPEQQKKKIHAVLAPNFAQEYQAALEAHFNASDEELGEIAEKLGLSVEQVKERREKLRALPADHLEQGQKGLKAASPEQIKDMNLLLRDQFTGALPVKDENKED